MTSTSKRIRDRLLHQNKLCFWCSDPVRRAQGHWDSATIEHVITRSRGGETNSENSVLAHWSCNQMRGTMKAHRFMVLIFDAKELGLPLPRMAPGDGHSPLAERERLLAKIDQLRKRRN